MASGTKHVSSEPWGYCMPFDDILTDSSDLLSQRLLAAGYTLEPDYYPNTKLVIANKVVFGDLTISYRVESDEQVFITYMESLKGSEGNVDQSEAAVQKGLTQAVKGLSRYAQFLVKEMPEMKRVRGLIRALADQGWINSQDPVQEVTTERLVEYAIKHFKIKITSVEENCGVWVECDLEALREAKTLQVGNERKAANRG